MVRPGIEPETSRTADWHLTNWANQAAVLVGGKPVGYLQSVVNLPLGSPRTNPFSSPSRGFEPGSSVFKSLALIPEPRCSDINNDCHCSNRNSHFLTPDYI